MREEKRAVEGRAQWVMSLSWSAADETRAMTEAAQRQTEKLPKLIPK